jgi:hypothetical protein
MPSWLIRIVKSPVHPMPPPNRLLHVQWYSAAGGDGWGIGDGDANATAATPLAASAMRPANAMCENLISIVS